MGLSFRAALRTGLFIALVSGIWASFAPAASAAQPESLERWYGDAESATGNAVSSGPCDVNGDGFDDAIVGAWFWDKPPLNNTGAAYVLFGGEDAEGGDLNDPASAGAVRIDGPAASQTVGIATACAGDVNGDDFDDFVVSDYIGNQAYVILGEEEFEPLDLATLGDRGFLIKGPAAASFSFGAYAAGDLNGDGLGEIGIAAIVADTQGRTNNGAIYVVAGKEDVADVDVTNPAAGELLIQIDGARDGDRLGSAAPAGDVDGDGVEDLIVGAYTSNPYPTTLSVPGAAWVVSGDTRGTLDLASFDAEDGFAIYGPDRQRDRLGISVDGAGDLNSDGFADLIVGGDGVYNAATGQRPGSAWIIFGSDSASTVFTDTSGDDPPVFTCADTGYVPGSNCTDPAARGYWIQGADSDPGTGSEATGYAVASIGDVNADGISDAAIGAYGYDLVNPASPTTTMAGAGALFVVYGKTDASTIDLATLTESAGYRIDGLAAGDRFGRAVGSLGDFDGNGARDFVIGADFASRPLPPDATRNRSGEATIALMDTFETSTSIELDSNLVDAGENVEITATVDNEAGSADVPGGAFTFYAEGVEIEGCTELAAVDGEATCTTSFETVGDYDITASFVNGGQYADSTSAASTLTVEPAPVAPVITPAESPLEIGEDGTAVAATIACGPGGQCTSSATDKDVRFGKKTRRATVTAPPTLAEDTTGDVVLTLSPRAQKRLEKRGEGTITIEVTSTSAEGGPATDKFRLRLVAAGTR